MSSERLIEVSDLRKWYSVRGEGMLSRFLGDTKYLKAVDDVDFDIKKGEIIGLAGQSGCGKSTLGELLVGLQSPTGGRIQFKESDISGYSKEEMKAFRRQAQIIFQDPYKALNPRFTVSRTIAEPLKIHGIGSREEREARTVEALKEAGLRPPGEFMDKLPGELSGGERQRVYIARALVLNPEFIVADEPVSMLDVSVRTGILHLFKRLQREHNVTVLYISHDLSTINYLTDRTMIMYLGDIVEVGPTEEVIHDPSHPYTETLLKSVPTPDPDVKRAGSELKGEVPDPVDLPQGCRFNPRCEYATEKCRQDEPQLTPVSTYIDTPVEADGDGSGMEDREVACYHPVNE